MKSIKYALTLAGIVFSFQSLAADGVARQSFTTSIMDHEPTNQVTELTHDTSKIYYFTEIRGLKDQTITHRWQHNGEIQASVSIPIGGDRWRVWSSKNLSANASGEWQVVVLDEAGSILSQNSFNYQPASNQENKIEPPQSAHILQNMDEQDLHKIAPAAGPAMMKTNKHMSTKK